MTEFEKGEITAGNSDFWDEVTMRIPSVPPTSLAGKFITKKKLVVNQ